MQSIRLLVLIPCVVSAVFFAAALAPAQTNAKPRILTGEIAFTKQLIDGAIDQNFMVAAADFDGDGDLDATSADYVNGVVYWYERLPSGAFQTRVVDPNLAGAYPVDVGDVDQDGHPDILVGGYQADLFVWYENDGSGGFTRRIVGSSDGPHSIVNVDLDRDGDQDFVTSSQDGDNIAWYENDGSMNFTPHVLTRITDGAKRADYADLDGDGDVDIVSASFFSFTVIWHENDGNQNFTTRILDSTVAGAYFVDTADLDGDGDLDVMAASQIDDAIYWYLNDGAGGFVRRVIDPSADGARAVIAADIDGDGDVDPLGASVDDDTIAWHENDGLGNFTQHTIDRLTDGAYGVTAIDMDGDGDLDVLSSARDAKEVSLHTQIKRHSILVTRGGTLALGPSILRTVDLDHAPHELVYTLTDAPDRGALRLNGSPLALGGTFTQADIDSLRVIYLHGGGDQAPDGFAFTVRDGAPGAPQPANGAFEIAIFGRAFTVLRLDEGSGTVANDASGSRNHGQLVGGPIYDASTRDVSPFCLRFDGVDDSIDLGRIDPNGPGLTLAAWMNVNQFTGHYRDGRVISKASSVSIDDHVFLLSMTRVDEITTRLLGMVRVGGRTTILRASSGNLALATWYHAALTHDGAMMRLFLDGVLVGETPLAGRMDVAPTMGVAVGSQPTGTGSPFAFNGRLDDVRILPRAMTPSEIARIASGCSGAFSGYGAGLAGSGGFVPRLSGSGCPRLGQTISIELTRGLGGATSVLLLSTSRAWIPLFGGTLLVDPLLAFGLGGLSGVGEGNGAGSLAFPIPVLPALIGHSVPCQGLCLDPGALFLVSLTQGLDVAIGS